MSACCGRCCEVFALSFTGMGIPSNHTVRFRHKQNYKGIIIQCSTSVPQYSKIPQ